jgi:hypothetical protein
MVLRFQHHNEQYISYIVTMVENIRVLGKSHRYIASRLHILAHGVVPSIP